MRVVGGKPDITGRREAVVVWTVPGGPADVVGIQQGDKVDILYDFCLKHNIMLYWWGLTLVFLEHRL